MTDRLPPQPTRDRCRCPTSVQSHTGCVGRGTRGRFKTRWNERRREPLSSPLTTHLSWHSDGIRAPSQARSSILDPPGAQMSSVTWILTQLPLWPGIAECIPVAVGPLVQKTGEAERRGLLLPQYAGRIAGALSEILWQSVKTAQSRVGWHWRKVIPVCRQHCVCRLEACASTMLAGWKPALLRAIAVPVSAGQI